MKPRIVGCCSGNAAVTQVVLNDAGVTVGIVGLTEIFRSLFAAGRSPDATGVAEEIVAMVKRQNYVSPAGEAQYRAALLREYGAFWDSRAGDRSAEATADALLSNSARGRRNL